MFFDQKFRMDENFHPLLKKEDIKWMNRIFKYSANRDIDRLSWSEVLIDFCSSRPWILEAGYLRVDEKSQIGDVLRIFIVTDTQVSKDERNACFLFGMFLGIATGNIMPVDIGHLAPDGDIVYSYRKEEK